MKTKKLRPNQRLGLIWLVTLWLSCFSVMAAPSLAPGTYQQVKVLLSDPEHRTVRLVYEDGTVIPIENLREEAHYWDQGSTRSHTRNVRIWDTKSEQYQAREREETFERQQKLFDHLDFYETYIKKGKTITDEESADKEFEAKLNFVSENRGLFRSLPPKRPQSAEQVEITANYSKEAFLVAAQDPSYELPKGVRSFLFQGERDLHLVLVSSEVRLGGGSEWWIEVLNFTLSSVNGGQAFKVASHPDVLHRLHKIRLPKSPSEFVTDHMVVQPLSKTDFALFLVDLEMGLCGIAISQESPAPYGTNLRMDRIQPPQLAHFELPVQYLFLPSAFTADRAFEDTGSLAIENWNTEQPEIVVRSNPKLAQPFAPIRFEVLESDTQRPQTTEPQISRREGTRLARMTVVDGQSNIRDLSSQWELHPDATIPSEGLASWVRTRMIAGTSEYGNAFFLTLSDAVETHAPQVHNRLIVDLLHRIEEEIPAQDREHTETIYLNLAAKDPQYPAALNHIKSRLGPVLRSGGRHVIVTLSVRGGEEGLKTSADLPSYHRFLEQLYNIGEEILAPQGARLSVVLLGPPRLAREALEYAVTTRVQVRYLCGLRVSDGNKYAINSEEALKQITPPMKIAAVGAALNLDASFLVELVRRIEQKSEGTEKPLEDLEKFIRNLRWAMGRIPPEATQRGEEAVLESATKVYLKIAQNRGDARPLHPAIRNAFRSIRSLLDANSPTRAPFALSQRTDILAYIEARMRQWSKEYERDGRGLVLVFAGPPGTGKTLLANGLVRILPADRVTARVVNASTPEAAPKTKERGTSLSGAPPFESYSHYGHGVGILRDEIHRKLKEIDDSQGEFRALVIDEINTEPLLFKDLLSSFGDVDKSNRREFDFDGKVTILCLNTDENDMTRQLDTLEMSHPEYRELSAKVFVDSINKAGDKLGIDRNMIDAFLTRVEDGLFYFRKRARTTVNEARESLSRTLKVLEQFYGLHRVILPSETIGAISAEVDAGGGIGNFRGADKVLPGILSRAIDDWEFRNPETSLADRIMVLRPPTDRHKRYYLLEDILNTPLGVREYVQEILKKMASEINIAVSNYLAAARQSMEQVKTDANKVQPETAVARWQVFLEAFVAASERPLEMVHLDDMQGLSTPYLPNVLDYEGAGVEERSYVRDMTDHLKLQAKKTFEKAFGQDWSQEKPEGETPSEWDTTGDSQSHDALRGLAAEFMQGVSGLLSAVVREDRLGGQYRKAVLSLPWIALPFDQYRKARLAAQSKTNDEAQLEWATRWWDRYQTLRNKEQREEIQGREKQIAWQRFHQQLIQAHENIRHGEDKSLKPEAYAELEPFVRDIEGIPDEKGVLPGPKFIEALKRRIESSAIDENANVGECATYPEMVAAAYALEDLLRSAALSKVLEADPQKQWLARGQRENEHFRQLLVEAYLEEVRKKAGELQRLNGEYEDSAQLTQAIARYHATHVPAAATPFWEDPVQFSEFEKVLFQPDSGQQSGVPDKPAAIVERDARRFPFIMESARESFRTRKSADPDPLDCVKSLVAFAQQAELRLPQFRKTTGDYFQSPQPSAPNAPSSPDASLPRELLGD